MSTTLSSISCGPIKRISISDEWTESEAPPEVLLARQMIKFQPSNVNDIEITLFNRGLPPDPDALNDLRAILDLSNKDMDLEAEHVASLSPIMGTNNAGDNQYTNPSEKGQYSYPVFNLTAANIVNINGRRV